MMASGTRFLRNTPAAPGGVPAPPVGVRRSRGVSGALAVASLAVVLALAGCSGGGGPTGARPPSTAFSAGLDAAVPEPPPGYELLDERSLDFDLERYATGLSVAPDGDRAALSAAGFGRGVLRAWTSTAGGLVVAVYIFELADADGARSVQEHFVVDGRELLDTTPFEVPGVAGAQGATYGGGTPESPTRVHAVYLTRGRLFYNVLASSADLSAGPGPAADFARQVASLSGGSR